jgi:CRP/FNR family transcriptional regulator, nitrogen oxide reductase regulator
MAINNSLVSLSTLLPTIPELGTTSPARQPADRFRVGRTSIGNRGNAPRVPCARAAFPQASLDGVRRSVQHVELFRDLSLAERGEIAKAAREQFVLRGETIFLEDDPVRFVYAVASGHVKTFRSNRVGKLVILHVHGPGEVVDGLGLSIGSSHSFTAQAMNRCQVLTWDVRVFEPFVRRFPALQRNATRLLLRRLRLAEGRVHELATERVPQRLARVLLRLIVQSGGSQNQSIDLSCEELAHMAGTTLCTVSRLLCNWAAEGIIQPERSAILVENLPGLIDVANGGGDSF